jgi:hypothetical protein
MRLMSVLIYRYLTISIFNAHLLSRGEPLLPAEGTKMRVPRVRRKSSELSIPGFVKRRPSHHRSPDLLAGRAVTFAVGAR